MHRMNGRAIICALTTFQKLFIHKQQKQRLLFPKTHKSERVMLPGPREREDSLAPPSVSQQGKRGSESPLPCVGAWLLPWDALTANAP